MRMKPAEEAESWISRRRLAVASGADQAGLRLYNERLILSLVRRYRQLSKIEVGAPDRTFRADRVGDHEPAATGRPVAARGAAARTRRPADRAPSLDPEGAFSLGLKIGRRSCELVLVDFEGRIRERAHETFAYPTPEIILDFASRTLPSFTANAVCRAAGAASRASASPRRSNCGTGARRSARRRARWMAGARSTSSRKSPRSAPFRSPLATTRPRPARRSFSSAKRGGIATFCISFSARSSAAASSSAARLFPGRTGNAGALGSMPVMPLDGTGKPPSQLIACASIYQLERQDRGGRARPLVDLAHAGGLGRFRRPSRRLDRGGLARARLRLRCGHFGDRFRGDRHRRRDADRGARPLDGARRRACFERTRPARPFRRRDHVGRDRRRTRARWAARRCR